MNEYLTSNYLIYSSWQIESVFMKEFIIWVIFCNNLMFDSGRFQRTFSRIILIGYKKNSLFILSFFRNVVNEFNKKDSLKNAQDNPTFDCLKVLDQRDVSQQTIVYSTTYVGKVRKLPFSTISLSRV